MLRRILFSLVFLAAGYLTPSCKGGCSPTSPGAGTGTEPAPAGVSSSSSPVVVVDPVVVTSTGTPGSVTIENATSKPVTVYLAFGADSVVVPKNIPYCMAESGLLCQGTLGDHASLELPTGGNYLNVTISFGAPVGCGTTKAELNVNNPRWYDVVDVSLVDGFLTPTRITIDGVVIEAKTAVGDNDVELGVYPIGCDLCTERSDATPCGQKPGMKGCKQGTQYAPKVPCQYQGKKMGGGSVIVVSAIGAGA